MAGPGKCYKPRDPTPMKTEALREARRINLKVALEAPGVVKKELGQKMGWADGSFIGQMAAGKRPITEELARQLEEHLGLPEKSLDMAPKQFEVMNPRGELPQEIRDARNAAHALAVLSEQIGARRKPPDPIKLGNAAAYIVEQTARMGPLTPAQIKAIVDKAFI